MRRATRTLVLVLLACGLCACGEDSSGSAKAPDEGTQAGPDKNVPPTPEGPDSVVPLATVAIGDGSLYNDIAAVDDRAYGCTAAQGLRVVRREGWDELVELGDVTFDGANGCRALAVTPSGDVFAAGVGNDSHSFLATISGGNSPAVASTVDLGEGIVEGLAATDSHVIAALGMGGIVVLGRNDGEMAEVGRLASGFEQALGVTVWGERVLVANATSGVVVVDLSDPSAPSIEQTFDTVGSARRIVMYQDLAYIATVTAGVAVHDPAATSPGVQLGLWKTHASSVDLAIAEDGTVFVANLEDVAVLDGANPDSLSVLATEKPDTPTGGKPRVVAVEHLSGLTYAAEWSALWTFAFGRGMTAPDIWLHKTSLDLGMVKQSKKGKGIRIRNLGTAELEISSATVDHPDFTIEVEHTKIPEGQEGFMQIVFTPQSDEEIETQARLITNDPDEAEVIIPISANNADRLAEGMPFDPNGQLEYLEPDSGQVVTVKGKYAGTVVILAYFGSS